MITMDQFLLSQHVIINLESTHNPSQATWAVPCSTTTTGGRDEEQHVRRE
jgi:hypothetical protein